MDSKTNSNQMRQEFIKEIYSKFDPSLNYYDFRQRAYYICATIGLHFHKEVRDLFKDSRWQENGYQTELMGELKAFLEKYIK